MYLKLLSTNKLLNTQKNTQNINLCALPGFESATPKIVEHYPIYYYLRKGPIEPLEIHITPVLIGPSLCSWLLHSLWMGYLHYLFIFSCQAITKVLTSKTINMSVWSLLDVGPSNYSLMFIILFTQNFTYLYYTSLLILIRIKKTAH